MHPFLLPEVMGIVVFCVRIGIILGGNSHCFCAAFQNNNMAETL